MKTCYHCGKILLSDHQRKIYDGLKSKQFNSPRTLARKFKISIYNANNQLKYLVNCGLVERKTVGKYYVYYIKEK